MKKKKSSGGGANWMDTYGDMVTLLLCFFVLLYSISTVDQQAWANLVMSFNPNALLVGSSDGGGGPSADGDDFGVLPEPPAPTDATQTDIDQAIASLYQAFQNYVSESSTASENVSVSRDENGRVYVTFKDSAFFEGDKYDLLPQARVILDDMCKMLSEHAYAIDSIRVQGHTAQANPNQPNTSQGDRFLASNRATMVVVYIQEQTDWDVLWPGKLVSEGFGQWHPASDNNDEEGRAKNRRVEMIISGRDIQAELEAGDIPSYSTGTGTSAQDGTE